MEALGRKPQGFSMPKRKESDERRSTPGISRFTIEQLPCKAKAHISHKKDQEHNKSQDTEKEKNIHLMYFPKRIHKKSAMMTDKDFCESDFISSARNRENK